MIKNIIFDLGGVILNISYELSIKSFIDLGVKDFDKLFSQASQSKLFDKFDKGEITPEQFRNEIKLMSGINLSDKQIDKAWNSMLLDFPPERLDLLNKVKDNYRVFLLSNTNAIHYPVYLKYLENEFGLSDLSHIFEKEYLSYKIGKRKPDKEAFLHVIMDKNLVPGETFFIDDSMQHIEGARKAGLHAHWLNVTKESIIELFDNSGNIIIE